MDKSRDISNVKTWRVIRATLITLALVLAGCQSHTIQSTAIPASTEIPATSTLTSTPTIEPTATTPPKFVIDGSSVLFWNGTEYTLTTLPEGFIPDHFAEVNGVWQVYSADGTALMKAGENWMDASEAVATDQGMVFVENGKMMVSKDGKVSEVKNLSTEVIFNNTKDASNIVYAMHKAEFDNQNLANWYPGRLASDFHYKNVIEKSMSYNNRGATNFNVAGIVTECVKVKSPVASSQYPVLGMLMINVFGAKSPVAVPLGDFDLNDRYHSLIGTANRNSAEIGISNNFAAEEEIPLLAMNWAEVSQLFLGRIVEFDAFHKFDDDEIIDHPYHVYDDSADPDSPEQIAFRQDLYNFMMVNQAPLGTEYYQSDDPDFQTGSMISAIQNGVQPANTAFFLPQLSYIKYIGD